MEAFLVIRFRFGKESRGTSIETIDLLTKEVDGFFHVVLTRRDVLLCNGTL